MSDFERELGWDDQIADEGGEYEPLPEGDYKFTVKSVERARSKGVGKLPACNMAKVTLTVHGDRDREITVNLVLHSTLEWKLSQFFLSIGMKKHGEPLHMNWPGPVTKTGNCHVTVRTFRKKDGGCAGSAGRGPEIVVRIPVIGGVNNSEENISASAAYVRSVLPDAGMELLPYHRLGKIKYEALGMQWLQDDFFTPGKDEMERLRELVREQGVKTADYR